MIARVYATVLALGALGGTATAADLPLRPAPALPPPVLAPTWSGFYFGVNAGYIGASNSLSTGAAILSSSTVPENAMAMATGATTVSRIGGDGFIGGGQIGYNLQLSPWFVAGLEADIQGSTLRGRANVATFSPHPPFGLDPNSTFLTTVSASRSLTYLGTVRGRVGVSVVPSLLLYATGGLAYGGVKASTAITQIGVASGPFGAAPLETGFGSFSGTRVGYALGGGAEWMFAPNWSAKIEYLRYDLGTVSYPNGVLGLNVGPTNFAGSGIASFASVSTTHISGNIVRAGLNYRFNWGAPL